MACPMKIQAPSRPFNFTMDPLTQMMSPGVTYAALWSLIDEITSLMRAQRYRSPLSTSADRPLVGGRQNLSADHTVWKLW